MKTKASLALFLLLSLTACGGGAGGGGSNPAASVITSVADAIKAAESIGATPTLNREDTVAGPDKDGNGVRDDIDAYIDSLPDTSAQKAALRQKAVALAKALTVDNSNLAAALAVAQEMAASTVCTHSRYDDTTAYNKAMELEKFTVNTRKRFDAYQKFNQALSGSTWSLPNGDTCVN